MSVSGGAQVAAGGGAPDRLAAAHARLLGDGSIQFAFETARPPAPPPGWLKALARWLIQNAPALQWVFWALAVVGVCAIGYVLVREFVLRPSAKRGGRPAALTGAEPAWRLDPDRARGLLADADALAAEGRYAEAARALLHRSVADISGRRPDLLRPALTSRDIAATPALPAAAREAFGVIARVVERGLFAGRAVGADGWAECRAAYERFAFPELWAGR